MGYQTVSWRLASQLSRRAGAGIAAFAPFSVKTSLKNVTLDVASGWLAEKNSFHCVWLKLFILKIKKTFEFTAITKNYPPSLSGEDEGRGRQEHCKTMVMVQSGVSDRARLVPEGSVPGLGHFICDSDLATHALDRHAVGGSAGLFWSDFRAACCESRP